jgi:hypothetical protein
MDDLDPFSPSWVKSMHALSQLSTVNVIVAGTCLNREYLDHFTRYIRKNEVIETAERQIETGLVLMERGIGVVGPDGDELPDGAPEYEAAVINKMLRESSDSILSFESLMCAVLSQTSSFFANRISTTKPATGSRCMI